MNIEGLKNRINQKYLAKFLELLNGISDSDTFRGNDKQKEYHAFSTFVAENQLALGKVCVEKNKRNNCCS